MCSYNTTTTPQIAGNLSVKTKAAQINPGGPGAPEVTKLERGGHFVQHNIILCVHVEQVILFGTKSDSLDTTCVSKIYKNGRERGPRGSPRAHTR